MASIKTAIVTGAAGLVGSETVRHFCSKGWRCIGIDNDLRRYFFGAEASTRWLLEKLLAEFPDQFTTNAVDIRDFSAVCKVFEAAGQVDLVVHTAAQPSHDWAAREPFTDFGVNAQGTLNILEALRKFAPKAPFIFTSTNKVYGDTPNRLPLVETETRWCRQSRTIRKWRYPWPKTSCLP